MVSLTAASIHFVKPHRYAPALRFPLISSLIFSSCRKRTPRGRRLLTLVVKDSSSLSFKQWKGSTELGHLLCLCKGWESDGYSALEEEIMDFMEQSKKPDEFPTKKELVEAGRTDLVDAIAKKGGWLSLGWESDDEEDELESDFSVSDFQRRLGSLHESMEEGDFQSTSSSGRMLEVTAEDGTGIEGILSRLNKERNLAFGIGLEGNEYGVFSESQNDNGHMVLGTSPDADMDDPDQSSRLTPLTPQRGLTNKGLLSNIDSSRDSSKPVTWWTWSTQRAGSTDLEFEAGEIQLGIDQMMGEKEDSLDNVNSLAEDGTLVYDRDGDVYLSEIKTRLTHLEFELSTALGSLRAKSEKLALEGHEHSSSDLQNLSDAWEFQENEFMNAQDKLRSIRAKLAVVKGKIALAIIDAQKIVEEKQKRIDVTHRALQLLRTACVVWPNSASEVFLAGSFDGWTSQRKMKKSRTGIFSVCLKLYPGRYEIKFIVDGTWRIDPLCPTVNNNGHENNILIIT